MFRIFEGFNFRQSNLKKLIYVGIIAGFLSTAIPTIANADLSVKTELKEISVSSLKEVYKGPFKHPFKLRPTTAQSLLESIQYSKNFITWSKPVPLFSSVLAEKLSGPLTRKFSRANRQQLVNFKVGFKQLKIEGEAFVNKYGLNWKIKSVHTKSKGFRESRVWDDSWKLVPNKNQFHWKEKDLIGNNVKNLKWVVIPKKNLKTVLSVARRSVASSKNQNSNEFNSEKFLRDLRNLKSLYRSGTLSRKEYYENLDKVIKSSRWNRQPLQIQSKVFKIIDNENLLPEQKRP